MRTTYKTAMSQQHVLYFFLASADDDEILDVVDRVDEAHVLAVGRANLEASVIL